MQEKIAKLTKLFEENRNEANAGPMEKYMKDQFPFLGIKTPLRRELEKRFFNETGILKDPFNQEFVSGLWEKKEREYQYTALDYLEKSLKKLEKSDLPFLESLLTTKSWWDTVDALAPKPVGQIAQKYPEVIGETIENWANHDNLWLRRAAILFQLKYKQETNEEILFQYILKNADSKEFFIQKAIGWALREYSKTSPTSVKGFIRNSPLAPLSIREGSKYLT
ncbi:DNA alkylation repair protein [Neobacillus ginsengisoli]|uniref:3-methyladenine DNA glycosylase AlkD n=1 Tax=Neobacillus ginsengisoli TaxID=904295 RepID=A0ABT9Y0A6_9BACI|nr:DNA alkylation repair protein [Neobacillus ginsengisoli]MDQ0200940.1 3-methyladenine DNA glycosylase AlkD [Neobacillus ginsengisoli]